MLRRTAIKLSHTPIRQGVAEIRPPRGHGGRRGEVKLIYDTAQIFTRRPPIDIPLPVLCRYDAQISFKP